MGNKAVVDIVPQLRRSRKLFPRPLRVILAGSSATWAFLVTALSTAPVFAQDAATPVFQRNNFGGVGLIEMPSARMAPDGELAGGASFFKNNQHYYFSFQALPWLETEFRYSGLQHFESVFPVYYDRSFAVKARLAEEGDWLPAIAVGADDIIGTGVYGSEYFVASKQFGAVDFSLGLGWGRKGSASSFQNPLILFSDSFRTRAVYPAQTAGGSTFSNLFHGPTAGIFGGATWATPIRGLTLTGEYSSDSYTLESQRGNFTPKSQFNFGAVYQVDNMLSVGLHWLYGKAVGASFSLDTNPVSELSGERIGREPSEPVVRSDQERQEALASLRNTRAERRTFLYSSAKLVDTLWQQPKLEDVAISGPVIMIRITQGSPESNCRAMAAIIAPYESDLQTVSVSDGRQTSNCTIPGARSRLADTPATTSALTQAGLGPVLTIDAGATPLDNSRAAIARIRSELTKQGITVLAIDLSAGVATVYYNNGKYYHERDVVKRITRVLMAQAPGTIEKFRIVAAAADIPQMEFLVLRAPLEREYIQTSTLAMDNIDAGAAPLSNPLFDKANRTTFPRLFWAAYPQFRQELFDPSNPFAVQFLAAGEVQAELFPGFSVGGAAEFNLYNNFNTGRPSDSLLPHVRSDFLRFFSEGKNGISALDTTYRFRLAPNLFGLFRAGYLESMYAGIGGELLWRPTGQRWSLGVDLYGIKERAFDRLFGLQNYSTVTGHVSLYYESPWYNLRFVLRAGQYLARDRGLTLEVTRKFETGVEIGAFMTKTNVSAAQFGEGSFDKGIMIRIPVGWVIPVNTQEQFNLDLRPVQRDGGQRLGGDAVLYDETMRTSVAELTRGPGYSDR